MKQNDINRYRAERTSACAFDNITPVPELNFYLSSKEPYLMKPWINKTLIGLFGVAVLAGGLSACNHSHHGFGANASAEDIAKFRGKIIDRVASKLEFDEAQKMNLSRVADTFQAQRAAMMAQDIKPRAELKTLIAGEKFDRTRAQTLITEKTTQVQTKSP